MSGIKLKEIPPVRISVTLDNVKYEGELHEDLVVGDGDINRHLDECSARYAYWAMLYALAIKAQKTTINGFKSWMAEKKKEVVSCAPAKTYGSETAKEDAILNQYAKEYAERNKAVIDAEYNVNILDVAAKAWEMKSHMLVALGSNYRQEMNSGLSIKAWNSQFQGTVSEKKVKVEER